MKYVNFIVSVCLTFILVACSGMTPQDRIRENPAMFRALSPEQQKLVQTGRISSGMSKDAVFLAWGKPSERPLIGQNKKIAFEKWIYTRLRPVMVERPCWGPPYAPGFGPYPYTPWETAYVPEVFATVTFEHGKVTEWEARPPQR